MGLDGVLLYDNKEEAINQLVRVRKMSSEERLKLGCKNKEFFHKYLPSSAMYDSYMLMLNSLT